MSFLKKLSLSDALHQWNNYTSLYDGIVPYSYNPSLFHFYQNHFNWKPYYFILYGDKEIAGLFPVVDTGRAMVSLPHLSYGGILGMNDNNQKGKTINRLLSYVKTNKLSPGFYKVELSGIEDQKLSNSNPFFIRSYGDQYDNNFIRSEKVTYLLNLTDEEQLFSSLNSNLRRKIRKASTRQFEIKTGAIELLNDFYSVYSKNIYQLGSLNYGKGFFKSLLQRWDYGKINLYVVYLKNKPVAGALVAAYSLFYENLYFATLPDVRRFYVADWLHWQMIKDVASDSRSQMISGRNVVYSFGRSTEFSTVHQYKTHWPVTMVPLYVYANINDLRQKEFLRKSWRVLPGIITRPLGAKLIKHIY